MAEAPSGVWLLVQAPNEAADRCYLFTDLFARLLQVAFACWSIFLLYVKRQLEFPKRPLLVCAPVGFGVRISAVPSRSTRLAVEARSC